MTGEGLKIFGALCFVEEFVTTQANSIRRIFDGQLMFVNLQVLIDLSKRVIQFVRIFVKDTYVVGKTKDFKINFNSVLTELRCVEVI